MYRGAERHHARGRGVPRCSGPPPTGRRCLDRDEPDVTATRPIRGTVGPRWREPEHAAPGVGRGCGPRGAVSPPNRARPWSRSCGSVREGPALDQQRLRGAGVALGAGLERVLALLVGHVRAAPPEGRTRDGRRCARSSRGCRRGGEDPMVMKPWRTVTRLGPASQSGGENVARTIRASLTGKLFTRSARLVLEDPALRPPDAVEGPAVGRRRHRQAQGHPLVGGRDRAVRRRHDVRLSGPVPRLRRSRGGPAVTPRIYLPVAGGARGASVRSRREVQRSTIAQVIKYLGSKRVLVPVLGEIASAVGPRTAVDLFTGTTRVAQEFKRRGMRVTATDVASYSEVLSDCYVATDARDGRPGRAGRGARAAERAAGGAAATSPGRSARSRATSSRTTAPASTPSGRPSSADHPDGPLRPILLTALLLAADRVDSTTGLQMAYLKQWSPRSHRDLELVARRCSPGPGRTIRGRRDARPWTSSSDVDLMYLDPPYNQHRYFTNYHVWETLVRWDEPEHYGIACKRVDARDDGHPSVFNRKADDARRDGRPGRPGRGPRCWWSPTTTSPGSPRRR